MEADKIADKMVHCPFCGSDKVKITSIRKRDKGDKITYYQGICNKCYARGPKKHTKIDAVRTWNTREYSKEINVDYLEIDNKQFERFLTGDIVLKCNTFEKYIALVDRCKGIIPNMHGDINWYHTWHKYKENTAVHAKSSIIDEDRLWFGFCYAEYYTEVDNLIVEDIITREVYTNEK